MANGSFNVTTSNGYITGRVDWNSVANVDGNYSVVTTTLYLSRTNTGYVTYGSGTMYLNINGTAYSNSGSWSIVYGSDTAVIRQTQTVYHDADGTKTIQISWAGDMDTPLTVNQAGGWATLDNIPRASTINSAISWTAGIDNLNIFIGSASPSYSYHMALQVQDPSGNWVTVAERSGITGSSYTLNFTVAESTKMYQQLSKAESRPAILYLDTYSGSKLLGESSRAGTCYGYAPGTPSFSNFNIGDSVPITINNYNSHFTYNIDCTFGSFTKSFTDVGASSALSFTTAEAQAMYAQVPNSNVGLGSFYVHTFYNGVEVNDNSPSSLGQSKNFNAYVTNSNPVLASGFSYYDNSAVTTAVTGNNLYIIQNQSDLVVRIPANGATAVNGASMAVNGARYEVSFNGKTKTLTYTTSATTLDFGTVDANSNANLLVKAIDSRGNSTSLNLQVNMVPYSLPIVTATAVRVDNFETDTVLSLSGSVSSITIGGVNKNTIASAQYQYRQKGGTYGALTSFSLTGFPTYSAADVTVPLDNTMAWDINFVVTDKLGNTSVVQSIVAGKPIFFIDSVKNSVGVNQFPVHSNSFEVSGDLYEGGVSVGSKYAPSGMVTMFAGGAAPNGWLLCQGQAVSRTTYANLFTAIGTIYGGGDGSTTFNLPNLQGRVPVGLDASQTEFSSLNTKGGEKTHVLTEAEIPSHRHSTVDRGGLYAYGGGSGSPAQGTGYSTDLSGEHTTYTGGGGAHNNLQPYITLNFIIKC